MTNLPLESLSKGQGVAPQLQVEPDTKGMQSHFGRQACLKAVQRMGTLTGKPKGVEQLAIDRFNDLTQSSQPASPVFGPAHLAFLMGRADDLSSILLVPLAMHLIACKAFVGEIDALCWSANTRQRWRELGSHGKKGLGQGMVVATACCKPEASNHARGGNRGEQMKPFIPANAVTPANIGLACQPAAAAPLGIACRNARTVQRFIQAALRLHVLNQEQTERHDDVAIVALQAIELFAIGQGRKGRLQVTLRIAVEGAFTGKLPLLAKHRQRHDFATRERCLGSRSMFHIEAVRLAKIINHHVQCCQKGILIYHRELLFLSELARQAHCRPQMPFFQVLSNSHQTFYFTT